MCRCLDLQIPSQSYHSLTRRILYVGRDLALLASLRELLTDCYIVRSPSGGVACTFMKSEIAYQLFLVDEQLMDMTGLELIRIAREVKHRERTPIIILTRERLRGVGKGVFCERPDNIKMLVRVIKRLLVAR
jgi:DNA-binding response OmpR family regulator